MEIYDLHQDRPKQDTPPGWQPIRQTRAKSYSRGTGKGKNKQREKDSERFEDEQATLPIIKKPIYPLSPLIVPKNHPTLREDNPTLPSLRDRQVPEFHRIPRENITRLDLGPTTRTMGRSPPLVTWYRMVDPATATVSVGHNGEYGRFVSKTASCDRVTGTAVASPTTTLRDGTVTARHIYIYIYIYISK